MEIDLVFIVMLTGHILGDFYFQTNQMATEKTKKFSAVLKHSLVYGLVMAAVLILGIPVTVRSLWLCVACVIAHFVVDSVKYLYIKHPPKCLSWVEKNLLIVDQAIHFSMLAVCWGIWGNGLTVRWFVSQEMTHLPGLPVTLCLGVLCILRPVGFLISESNLKNYKPKKAEADGLIPRETKNAGRIIGYLERLIVFILLLFHQFGAIAFVLTAKSVARFKEIEKEQALAEYYLIGTLMSVGSAIVITVLLGLCQTST